MLTSQPAFNAWGCFVVNTSLVKEESPASMLGEIYQIRPNFYGWSGKSAFSICKSKCCSGDDMNANAKSASLSSSNLSSFQYFRGNWKCGFFLYIVSIIFFSKKHFWKIEKKLRGKKILPPLFHSHLDRKTFHFINKYWDERKNGSSCAQKDKDLFLFKFRKEE